MPTKRKRKAGRPPKPGGPGRPIRIAPAQIEECERVTEKHVGHAVQTHEAVGAVLEIGLKVARGENALVSPESFAVIEREIAQHSVMWALSNLGYQTRLDEQGNVVVENPERPPLGLNETRVLSPTIKSQAASRLFH